MNLVDQFVKNGYEVTVYPTQKPQDAMELVQGEAGRFDLVVCSGGDGTLDEVVSGMMKRNKKVPIGYIPSGSTNDFAGSLKIPKNMDKAAQMIMGGVPFACDIGSFNGEYFVYIAAFGLFTDVSYATRQELKNRIGHVAYIIEGVKRIASIQSFHLQISAGDQEIEDVKLDDGMIEVTLNKMPKNPIELNEIIGSLTNLIDDTELIYTFKTDRLMVKSLEKIPWTLDGEYGGEHLEALITNQKQAVEIIVRS